MTNNKKLTVLELKKQAKQLDRKRDFDVKVGDTEFSLQHDVTFKISKQNKLLEDLVLFFGLGAENVEMLELSTPYTALLMLKHFTNLDVSDDVSDALATLEVLQDLEVFDVIVNELPEEEVKKVFELIMSTVTRMTEGLDEAEMQANIMNGSLEAEVAEVAEEDNSDKE